jgi:biotin operon repressor
MSQIGAMALGYGSRKYCPDRLCLSDKAVGRTVERLRKRGLFVKASPDNGRTTYYSNQLTQEQLTAYIAEIQVRRAMKRPKPTNRSISNQIKTLVDRMTRSPPSPPSSPPSG